MRLLVGLPLALLLASAPAVSAASFSADYYGTARGNAPELELTAQILGETLEPDGRTRLEFTITVHNTDSVPWQDVQLKLSQANLLNLGYDAATDVTDFVIEVPALPAFATLPGTAADTITVVATAGDLDALRAGILDGSLLSNDGIELWLFDVPVVSLDEATDNQFLKTDWADENGNTKYIFSASTPWLAALQPGDVMVYAPLSFDNAAPPIPGKATNINGALPSQVDRIEQDGDEVVVWAKQLNLMPDHVVAMRSFETLQDYFGPLKDPTHRQKEDTFTQLEELARQELADSTELAQGPRAPALADLRGVTAVPIRFNQIQITDHLAISGSALMRSSDYHIGFKIRNAALEELTVHLDVGIALNILLETTAAEDNSGAPLVDVEKRLVSVRFPLPPIPIGDLPTEVELVFNLDAGARVNGPPDLTIPFKTESTLGVDFIWENGQMRYVPTKVASPIRISDPQIFEAVSATAEIWLKPSLGLSVSTVAVPNLFEAYPYFATTVRSTFTLSPLQNPWWDIETDLEFSAGFEFDFFGASLIDAEGTIATLPLDQRDAAAPLDAPIDPQIPASGLGQRWARVLQPSAVNQEVDALFMTSLTPGTDVLIGGSFESNYNFFARVTAGGDLVWLRQTDVGIVTNRPRTVVAEPDGGFTAAGAAAYPEFWVARYDADGNRLWIVNRRDSSLRDFTVRRILRQTAPGGTAEYLLVGDMLIGGSERDPVFVKLDAAGAVLWAKRYTPTGGDRDILYDAVLLPDGTVAACGTTDANLPLPTGSGAYSAHNAYVNGTPNGLLMIVDPADGAPLRTFVIPSTRALELRAITTDPEGIVYVTGNHFAAFDETLSLYVGRYDIALGSFDNRLFTSDTIDNLLVEPSVDQPAAVSSWYDAGASITWNSEGLWLCGTAGLGSGRSGWMASLTDRLGVKWFSGFNTGNSLTNGDDRLFAVADGGDGLLVGGYTDGLLPLETGGTPSTVLMKLPWEGVMRYRPDASIRTGFIQLRNYGGNVEFATRGAVLEAEITNTSDEPAVTVADLTFTTRNAPAAPVLATPLAYVALEYVPPLGQPPTITTHPLTQDIPVGTPITLTVAATGTAPFVYQWRRNGVDLPGAIATELQLAGGPGDAGSYDVIVSNFAGDATSEPAIITITIDDLLAYALDGAGAPERLDYLPDITFDPANGGTLTLSFLRAASDVTYTVEATSDLVNWTILATDPGSVGELALVTEPTPPGATQRFVRLAVTANGVTQRTLPEGHVSFALPAGASTRYLGQPLLAPAVVRGTVGAAAGNTVALADAVLDPGEFAPPGAPHWLRVVTGAQAGRHLLITGSTATTLTVDLLDDTAAPAAVDTAGWAIAPGDVVEIAPADTLGSLFTGVATSGTSPLNADTISLWNGTRWVAYYYSTTRNTWLGQLTGNTSQTNLVLHPERGWALTRRNGRPAKALVLRGAVPESPVLLRHPGGGTTRVTAARFPVAQTLEDFAYAGPGEWRSRAALANADTIALWDGTKWQTFWRTAAGRWRRDGDKRNRNYIDLVIPAGTAVSVVRRVNASDADTFFSQPLPYPDPRQ